MDFPMTQFFLVAASRNPIGHREVEWRFFVEAVKGVYRT
jgi:hypothetical protein